MFSDHNGIIIRNRLKRKAHSAHTGNQKRFGNLKTFFKYLWSRKNLERKLANISNNDDENIASKFMGYNKSNA